jgi:gliding motility-associated-like protein
VTGTDGNGCASSATTTITIIALPTVTATNTGPYCPGDAMSVSEIGGAALVDWLWVSTNGAATITNTTDQAPMVTGGITGEIFTVTATDAYGCVDSSQTTITINPEPDADFEVSGGSCESAEFTARGIEGVVPILTWYWAFGDGNFSSDPDSATHVYTSAGSYDVTLVVTSNSGCVDTVFKPAAVNAYAMPTADFEMTQNGLTLNPHVTTMLSPSIDFVNTSSSNIDSVIWDFGDEESGAENTSNDLNPIHMFSDAGTYTITLTVYTSDGCMDIIVQELVVEGEYILFAPNAFTPDGDGFNDFFLPKGVGITGEDFDLMIYNRWGDLIREVSGVFSDDVTAGWDGKANNGNGIVQMDVYVWVIHTRDSSGGKHQYIGHVTLLQ